MTSPKDFYRTIFEESHDVILIADMEGNILDANPAASRLYGYSLEELRGMAPGTLMVSGSRFLMHSRLEQVAREKDAIMETAHACKDGTIVYMEARSSVIDYHGAPAILNILRDITKRLQAEEEIRRLAAIVEQSQDAILIADASGRILDANPAAIRTYGYSLEELRNLPPGALFADPNGVFEEELAMLMEKGDLVEEVVHRRQDGTILSLESHVTVGEYEGAPAILSILRDVTPRAEAEAEIRRLAALVDSSEDAIFVKELDGTIATWNPGAERLYGYTGNEIIGRNASVLLPPDRSDEVARILDGIAQGERFDHYETLRVAKDGRIIDVSITISPVKDAAGEIVGASSVARDITVRKKTEEQLRKANEELEAFASVVSHDLRGPLAAIRVGDETLRTLMAGEQTDETRAVAEEVVDLMHRSLLRADHLIDNLLRLAGAGQVPSQLKRVDVGRVVAAVLEERASDIASRDIEVETSDDLGELMADPTHIYQLFSNLIGNAITHNDSERPTVRVLRRPDDAAGRHRYVICDNGSGIPEKDMGKIFTPFFKGKSGGTGIGLSIVHKIAEVYGGGVTARNEGGTCFEVTLQDFPGQE